MVTPDAQARTLGNAIEAQQRQRDAAREVARDIERERQRERETGEESEPE